MTNAERFKQLMKIVSTNYDKDLKPEQLELFQTLAKQWGIDQFYNAMMAHMQDPDAGMYFPNMAHLSKHIQGSKRDNEAIAKAEGEGAWLNVMNAIRRYGSYQTPKFKDPKIPLLINRMGGWVSLCAKEEQQLVWAGKEFVAMYQEVTPHMLDHSNVQVQGLEDMQASNSQAGSAMAKLTKRFENEQSKD